MVGSQIGERYRIIQELGRGAFGQTYLAEDTQIPGNPQCVVKQLKPRADDELTLREARRLFNNEAIVLSRLNHPQIPRLLAHYQHSFHLVQEFVEGNDLSAEIYPRNQWNEPEVVELLIDVLIILEFIHQQNVIHRDIKPSNLIRRNSDRKLILIDFGAVKEIQTLVIGAGGQPKPSIIVGTHGYMPTEQLKGRPRPNSDIYALGVMAILALTGLSIAELKEDPATGELAWRQHTQVSRKIAHIMEKMVHSDCRLRYSSATEVLKDLGIRSSSTFAVKPTTLVYGSRWRRWLPWGISGMVAALAGVLLVPHVISIYLFNQANNLVQQQQYREAISAYNQVLKQYPQSHQAWVGRGYALSQLNRFEEMLTSCTKAVEIHSKFVEGLNCQGLAQQSLGENESAVATFKQIVTLKPDFDAGWNNLGEVLMSLEKYGEALKAFDRAISLNRDYDFAWNNRGNALFNMKRYDEAIAAYDKAIELDPEYAYAWNGRGNAYRVKENYQQALSNYQEAIALRPNFYEAWYNQGLVLENLQNYQAAFEAVDRAVKLKPDYQAAIMKRASLRRQLLKMSN